MGKSKEKLLGSIIISSFLAQGCVNSSQVTFGEQAGVIRERRPLDLVVEIDGQGRLSLNKIETGTVKDMSILKEKLHAVLADRDRWSIPERDVVIEVEGSIDHSDLDALIGSLKNTGISQITVLTK